MSYRSLFRNAGRFSMGLFHPGVPPWLVTWVVDSTPIRRAIETGTYYGESTALLADRIGPCTSIEIDPELAARAQRRFESRADIKILLGDSRQALGDAQRDATGPIFYWLDGHWSGRETGGESDPCPVLREIDQIHSRLEGATSVVAIDDARLFAMSHSADASFTHWPRLITVLQALERNGSQTFLVDDVIIAVPPDLSQSFMALHSASGMRQLPILHTVWPDIERALTRKRMRKHLRARIRSGRLLVLGMSRNSRQ